MSRNNEQTVTLSEQINGLDNSKPKDTFNMKRITESRSVMLVNYTQYTQKVVHHKNKKTKAKWIYKPEKARIQIDVAKQLLKRVRKVGNCQDSAKSNILCAKPKDVLDYKPIEFIRDSLNPCVFINKTSMGLVVSNSTVCDWLHIVETIH